MITAAPILRVGTRPSRLARAQAELVAGAIVAAGLADAVDVVVVRTRGDAASDADPRGRNLVSDGQFTAELERAVAERQVDIAVHSYKDLPIANDGDVVVAAVLPRADARDCLLTHHGSGLAALSPGAVVGTGSVRREAQLRALRPDLVAAPIRGNVDTRVARMRSGEYDAVLLACAGLDRLGITYADGAAVSFEDMLPAPAQGAVAVQVLANRTDLLERLAAIDDAPTRLAVETERALLVRIGGGCLAPLGALAEIRADELRLRAVYGLPGSQLRRVDLQGAAGAADSLVQAAARGLLAGAEASP